MSLEKSEVILRAEHISKSYGEKQVLQDISIHLKKGELVVSYQNEVEDQKIIASIEKVGYRIRI